MWDTLYMAMLIIIHLVVTTRRHVTIGEDDKTTFFLVFPNFQILRNSKG